MARPVLGMGHDHGVGDGGGDAEPPRGGEHGVALLAGDQLGVEIPRAARGGDALEEGDVAGEEDEAGAVVAIRSDSRTPERGERFGPFRRSACRRAAGIPMNRRDRPAQRCPPALVRRQRDGLLLVGDQVRAEDRAHAGGIAGALELDRPVDAVGVGAGECPVAPLRGGGRRAPRGWRRRCRRRSGNGCAGGSRPRWLRFFFGYLRRMYPQDRARQAAAQNASARSGRRPPRGPTTGAASSSARAS